jgi:hypothetical protein
MNRSADEVHMTNEGNMKRNVQAGKPTQNV